MFPDNLFDEQFQVMKAMHDSGHVRVARPLWFEEDDSVVGAPFFVMEKVQGRVPVSVPPYAQTGMRIDVTAAADLFCQDGVPSFCVASSLWAADGVEDCP